MKLPDVLRSPSCIILAFLGLALVGVAMPADAKKEKCRGTKQERKQKMPLRSMSEQQFEKVIADYNAAVAADLERVRQAAFRRIEAEYAKHQATGAPFVYDILILSGGGAKGAFGTGFLQGWGSIAAGPDARPEFDLVTGVSTGALIAPFAFIGTDQAYATIADLYANPEPDWVDKRGLIPFLPKHTSLFNTCRLRDAVWKAADPSVVEAVGAASAADRVLLVGATNLDLGRGRAIDLGHVAREHAPEQARDEVVTTLMASSAIPGLFPPVLLDGLLYADGGATSNLFIVTFPGPGGPIARFKEAHPDAPSPRIRLWVIVSQKLHPKRDVIDPRWVDVSGQALSTLTSTSQRFALSLMQSMVREGREDKGLDVELRVVSIPDATPDAASKNLFDKPYMLELQELGRTMGADPASWVTTVDAMFAAKEHVGD